MKQTMKFRTRDMHSICTEGSVSSSKGTTKDFELFRCTITIVSPTTYESSAAKNSGKQGNEILHSDPDSFCYRPIRKT